jgi:glycogen phosphorylase
MARAAGEENFFLFGLTAQQLADSSGWYDPNWHHTNEPETRAALDLIASDYFSRNEPGVFGPIRETLLTEGDRFRHLAGPVVREAAAPLRPGEGIEAQSTRPDAWSTKPGSQCLKLAIQSGSPG